MKRSTLTGANLRGANESRTSFVTSIIVFVVSFRLSHLYRLLTPSSVTEDADIIGDSIGGTGSFVDVVGQLNSGFPVSLDDFDDDGKVTEHLIPGDR